MNNEVAIDYIEIVDGNLRIYFSGDGLVDIDCEWSVR